MEHISLISIAILATTVAALPFGLVNLKVLDIAYLKGTRKAMQLAHGAAWVEVLFGIISIFFGGLISNYTSAHPEIRYLFLLIPGMAGIIFLLKRKSPQEKLRDDKSGFLNGVFLNLISIQVLLFWLIAITYINTVLNIKLNAQNIILFVLGIWMGKMGILFMYASLSQRILSKSAFLSRNVNQIIGFVLIVSTVLQFLT